jgi:hypothetical protein
MLRLHAFFFHLTTQPCESAALIAFCRARAALEESLVAEELELHFLVYPTAAAAVPRYFAGHVQHLRSLW